MGYRSQVAGIISVDRFSVEKEGSNRLYDYDRAKFTEMIGFIKLTKFYELWNTREDGKHFGWKDGAFILYGTEWKWYPDYPDVMAWDEMWKNMQTIEGISGYFCRVGEESDDIVHMEFGDDPCYDYFHAFTALSFEGNDYLGVRNTNDEENKAEQASTNPQEKSCGSSVADSAQA